MASTSFYDPTTKPVTVTVTAGGTVDVSSDNDGDLGTASSGATTTFDATPGSQITLTANPDSGYSFTGWTGSDAPSPSTTNPFTDGVGSGLSVTANFVASTVTITPSVAASDHGSISPSTAQTYSIGATPTFTFNPDTGYHVSDVQVDGSTVSWNAAGNSYTFGALSASHTIQVTFAINTYTITPSVAASDHGSISPNTAQTVDYGTTPKFAFTPDTNYHVSDVKVDGTSVSWNVGDNSYTFAAVTASQTIEVYFEHDTTTMTVSYLVNGDATGSSAPSISYYYHDASQSYTLTGTPTDISVDIGSTWMVSPNPLSGSTTDKRWYSSDTLSATATGGTFVFTYYLQWNIPAKFSTSDSSNPSTDVVLSGTKSGDNTFTLTLKKTDQDVWLDDGTEWSVNNPIPASPTTERWYANSGTSGTVGSSTVVTPLYYHQFIVSFAYTTNDGSTINSMINFAHYRQFGISQALTTDSSGTLSKSSDWVDAGSTVWYGSPNYIAPTLPQISSTERFIIASDDTFGHTVISSVDATHTTANPEFYHQYLVTFQYSLDSHSSDAPSGVTAYYTNFDVSRTITVSKAASTSAQAWVDASTAITYDNPLTGSDGNERWQTNLAVSSYKSTVDSSVTSSETLNPMYYQQFSVSFAYTTNDDTKLISQTDIVTYRQFGNTLHLSTDSSGALTLSSDWADVYSSVIYNSPVPITSDERYIIALGDSGVHSVIVHVGLSTRTANPTYYHQYFITLGYTDQDESTIEGGHNSPTVQPIGSYVQFGSSKPINPGSDYGETNPSSAFVDAGSNKVSYIDYTAASYAQRWKLSTSPHNLDVDSSTTLSESGYFHQYLISATISDGLDNEVALTDIAVSLTAKQLGSSNTASFTVNDVLTTSHSTYFDSESTLTYSYPNIISCTVAGKQYAWATTTGAGSADEQTERTGSFYIDDYA